MKLFILLSLIVIFIFSSTGLNDLIEINGQERYLIGHITASLLDPQDPSSTTDVIRYSEKVFYLKGDLLSLEPEDIEKDLRAGNFYYTPFYTVKKTRLSHGRHVEVGAIILGTTDPKVAKLLHLAAIRNIIDLHYEKQCCTTKCLPL